MSSEPSFEEPQLEFDEDPLNNASLSLNVGESFKDSDGHVEILDVMVNDDDFEVQLGSAAQVHDEDLAESEFHDISKFGVVELAGDDTFGRKVVVFSSCRLPPHAEIDHGKLLKYLQHTLDQYVESDYILVYFHHGLNKQNKPSYKWLLAAYRELDRKYKKNLKALYIVHPTKFIKMLWGIFLPFISAKFGKKITYFNYLHQLKTHLPLGQLRIPDLVVKYDDQLLAKQRTALRSAAAAEVAGVGGASSTGSQPTANQQFCLPLDVVITKSLDGAIPNVIRACVVYLQGSGMTVEGLFRRSASATAVREVQAMFNNGQDVDFEASGGAHMAAVILKTFLRELPEPLLTFDLYDYVIRIHTLDVDQQAIEVKRILGELPLNNYRVLQYVMEFLVKVASNSTKNWMDERNLAVVFGPNLLWPRSQASLVAIQHINSFTELLLLRYSELFTK